jgi:mannose-6-phosphate isomerase-like protein (cupin superfamily)
MEYRDVGSAIAFSSEKMKKTGLLDSKHLFCDLYCFEPGQAQKLHAHEDSDKVYFVLEGKGKFKVGEEERELAANHITLAPAGKEHGVVNHSDQRLVLLVFMAPNPNTSHSHHD